MCKNGAPFLHKVNKYRGQRPLFKTTCCTHENHTFFDVLGSLNPGLPSLSFCHVNAIIRCARPGFQK